MARILCVDDNPAIIDSTVPLLESVGFEARGVTDANTALEVAAEYRPDACVLDISMPGMNGYDLARGLKALLGDVYLVAVTGNLDHERQLREAGFDHRLIKPANPLSLCVALDRGLEGRRPS